MKTYCVHIYQYPKEYENIRAQSPDNAERQARERFPKSVEIDYVEVMRQCKCGTDNDTANKKCEECGCKL